MWRTDEAAAGLALLLASHGHDENVFPAPHVQEQSCSIIQIGGCIDAL